MGKGFLTGRELTVPEQKIQEFRELVQELTDRYEARLYGMEQEKNRLLEEMSVLKERSKPTPEIESLRKRYAEDVEILREQIYLVKQGWIDQSETDRRVMLAEETEKMKRAWKDELDSLKKEVDQLRSAHSKELYEQVGRWKTRYNEDVDSVRGQVKKVQDQTIEDLKAEIEGWRERYQTDIAVLKKEFDTIRQWTIQSTQEERQRTKFNQSREVSELQAEIDRWRSRYKSDIESMRAEMKKLKDDYVTKLDQDWQKRFQDQQTELDNWKSLYRETRKAFDTKLVREAERVRIPDALLDPESPEALSQWIDKLGEES